MPERLRSWPEICRQFNDLILIGNGASRAASPSFSYASLLDYASDIERETPLTAADRKAFEIVNETDFERVLGEIDRAALLASAAGVKDPEPLRWQYLRIRDALTSSIGELHPRHGSIPRLRLYAIQRALLHFQSVFTTNYDFLIYWAMTAGRGAWLSHFKDFFWNPNGRFDPANTNLVPGKVKSTVIHYLHGGLHLFQLRDGWTVKATSIGAGAGATYTPLLDVVFNYQGARSPLLVAEGSSPHKLEAIRSNEYLSFTYTEWRKALKESRRSLVIFGHQLSEQDDHLLQPIVSAPRTVRIAVSIHGGSSARSPIHTMEHFKERLRRNDLVFFDSSTHLLGATIRQD